MISGTVIHVLVYKQPILALPSSSHFRLKYRMRKKSINQGNVQTIKVFASFHNFQGDIQLNISHNSSAHIK